jgi:hypothetical protein
MFLKLSHKIEKGCYQTHYMSQYYPDTKLDKDTTRKGYKSIFINIDAESVNKML